MKIDTELIRTIVDVFIYEPLYDNLPLPLFQRKATIALMTSIQCKQVTPILQDGKWTPVNIFGQNFCPFEAHVANVHLCFNKYILYQALDSSMMLKNVLTNAPDEQLYRSSKFFRSRSNRPHLIRNDEKSSQDVRYKWDHEELNFIRFSSANFKLCTAHRDGHGRLVAPLGNGLVLKFSDNESIYSEREQCETSINDVVDNWPMGDDGVFS